MKFTRLTALALALVMALSLVTVAQADDKPSTWISDELVEIRIMRDENPNQPIKLDTIKLQTIEELLNVRLIVEAPPKASYSDKKSVLIATDDMPDIMYVDFADVRSIMKDAGYAHMGVGSAKGAGKAENAAKAAISSPLLETSIAGAHGVIINITSSPDIGLEDVETAAGLVTQSAHPDANIIWGTAFDENLSDEMRVTVVATGFDNKIPEGLRSTLNGAAASVSSTPSAVFSSDVAAAKNSAAAASAAGAAKPVEEESSDNRYYDELLAILNKRK